VTFGAEDRGQYPVHGPRRHRIVTAFMLRQLAQSADRDDERKEQAVEMGAVHRFQP